MVSVAYVLAAGLGTRLRPLTEQRPKPLLEVCGTPLVHFALGLLERAGVRRVGLNSHWLHPRLPDALGERFGGMEIVTVHEPAVLGTGGGLRGLAKALPAPAGEKVLVMNADALIDVDLEALVEADREDALATLVLKETPDVDAYGAIGTDAADRITDFAGRAHTGSVVRRRMFCGVHLVHPRAFEVLPDVTVEGGVARGPQSGINDEGYPVWMMRGEALYAFDTTGTFCDVGTPERLLEANLSVLSGAWSSNHLRPFARLEERAPRVFVSPRARVHPDAALVAPVLVDDDAEVGAGARVASSVVGKRARVAAGARLNQVVIQSDSSVDGDVERAVLLNRAVGPNSPGSLVDKNRS